ncbi:hypothetical protein FI667_g11630, partial [Globisporangium splendens]
MERHNRHERLASRLPTQQDERVNITAMLEEIRQRRDCLSRGSVLDSSHRLGPRGIFDPHGSDDRGLMLQHTARGMLSTATLDGALSRPKAAITTVHEDRSPHSPIPSQRIVWVRKSIKRWQPKQNTMEDVGSVEFATVAPLASVRRLIDQFYPLSHHLEYEFVHPELHVRIDPSDEHNVLPAAFPNIVLEVLPQQASPKHEPLLPVTTAVTEHKSLIERQTAPEHHRQPRADSPPKMSAKYDTNSSPIAKKLPHAVATLPAISSAPAIYRDRWLRDIVLSGVRCDLLFREFPDKNIVGVKAYLRGGGAWVGRATPHKWLSVQEVNALTKQEPTQQDAPISVAVTKAPASSPALTPAPVSVDPAPERRRGNLTETKTNTKEVEKSQKLHTDNASKDAAQQVTKQIPEPAGDSSEFLATRANSTADRFVDEMGFWVETDPFNPHFSARVPPIETEEALKRTDLFMQDDPSDSETKADDLMPPAPSPVHLEERDDGDPVAVLDTQNDSRTELFPPPTSFDEETTLPTPDQHVIAILGRDDTPATPSSGADAGAPEVAPIEFILAEFAEDFPELTGKPQTETQAADASASINVTNASREYIPLEPTSVAPLEEETSAVAVVREEKSTKDKQPSTAPVAEHISIPETKPDLHVENKAEKIDVRAATEEKIQGEADAASTQDPDASPSPEFKEKRRTTDPAELRLLEKYIQVVMDKFLDEFEDAEQNITSCTDMFSRDQLHRSFLQYGVNHLEFGLNGIFLAIEDDLNTYATWSQTTLDSVLKTYLMKLLPQNTDDASNLSWLFRLECALNVLTDMRSWHEPTRIRIACIEAHSSNSFLPPQAVAPTLLASSSTTSTDPKLLSFRLSDKDRELLAAVHTNDQLVSSSASLESWMADGLEILYLFLYSFLNSARNYSGGSTSITKMMFCRTRSERLQTTVQKVITLDPTVWRKLEFLYSEIEDTATMARLNELMASFLGSQRSHMKALDSCVFFQALVAFIARKVDQIAQSVLQFVTSPSTQLDSTATSRCVASFCKQLERSQFGLSSPLEGYLRNFGLKTLDMDKINKVRSSRKLSRMNLSGKHSLATHHHAELMGSSYALHLRPRWNHAKLSTSGSISRYVFHDEPSIALEAVYVRRKLDVTEFHSKSWDEMQRFAEEGVREAFKLLCSGAPLKSGGAILLGMGVNAFHLDSLADLSKMNTQWNAMMLENANARSLSIGHFVSKDTDIAAVRIEFRVHVDVEQMLVQGADDPRTPSLSIADSLDTFFRTATEDALRYVLETKGLDSLFGCLDEILERQWREMAFGGEFHQHLITPKVSTKYPRDTILNCINACMAVLPKSLTAVTKRNVQIITELVVLLSGTSAMELATIGTALCVLNEMCSAQEKPRAPPAVRKAIEPFTELQRKFAAEEGLKFLINAAEKQLMLEEIILLLMKTAELAGNRAALLVHCRHWMTYFIENGACTATRENVEFVPLLLQEIHNAFFSTDSTSELNPASTVYCACGCKGTALIKSVNGMMEVYLRLLLCEKGVVWAQDAMQGPLDCLVFLSWTLNDLDPVVQMQQRPLQLEVFDTLRQVLSRMKSGDRYLHFLSALTPALLKLLTTTTLNATLQRAVVRTLSLALEASIEKSVWKISPHSFLDSLYAILQALSSEPSLPSSYMNKVMVTTLLSSTGGMPSKLASNSADTLRALLHQDSMERETSDGRSLLQLLLQLMNFQGKSSLQSRFQIPILVVLGWLVNSFEVAEDCVELGLDLALLELVEGDATVQSILASRVLCQVQMLLWRFIRDREYVAEHHMVLYVFALRNIVFALRFDSGALNALSIYNDLTFLKKVLLISRKKSSKLLSELASGLLWALASAFESTDVVSSQFAVEFDDPDKLAALSAAPTPAGSLPTIPTTSGVIMLSENILAKLTSGGAIDCNIGALSSLLQSKACGEIFLRRYGYPFVIKLIDSFQRAGISGTRKASVVLAKEQQSDSRSRSFGPGLVYGESLPRRDKELIQLCHLAHCCLSAMLRFKSKAIGNMIPRTKSKVLPLLDHENVLLLHQILLCLIVHLKAHPQKCTELIESSVVDIMIALMFDPAYARLQVTAFTCLRMILTDPKCLTKPYALGDKLFQVRREVVSCFLRSSSFEITEQALVLAVNLIFHLQDENLVHEFAAIFTESLENQLLLADLFTRLSTQFAVNPKTGYVLQLLVRLVVQLDLTALTDTEQLVEAICLTPKAQTDTTFLRPTLCYCLLRIASEGDKAESFARKSRLHTIIDLLDERPTLGEFRNISELLIILARQHEGIRGFLSCSESGCIAKIGKVLGAFSEISSDSGVAAAAGGGSEQNFPESDELYSQFSVNGDPNREDSAKYVVKLAAGKHVFISHYMDDIYEQVVGLSH